MEYDPAKAFQVRFWLDNGGGQHPDARRTVGVSLAPEETHVEPEATLYIGGAKGDDKTAWNTLRDTIKAGSGITCHVYALP